MPRRSAEKIVHFAVESLARVRAEKGVSYEELGGLTGLHPTALSRIERHERRPTTESLYRIALALKVSLAAILKIAEKSVEKA